MDESVVIIMTMIINYGSMSAILMEQSTCKLFLLPAKNWTTGNIDIIQFHHDSITIPNFFRKFEFFKKDSQVENE